MNELIPVIATSPLHQRLIDDMTMRRFSHETQRNYIRGVGRFATRLGARRTPRRRRISAGSRSSSRMPVCPRRR